MKFQGNNELKFARKPIIYSCSNRPFSFYDTNFRVTRSKARELIIEKIMNMLYQHDNCMGRENRIKSVKNILDVVVNEGQFLMKFSNFRNTIQERIKIFAKEKVFFPEHYQKLLNEVLPGYDELLEEYSLDLIDYRN